MEKNIKVLRTIAIFSIWFIVTLSYLNHVGRFLPILYIAASVSITAIVLSIFAKLNLENTPENPASFWSSPYINKPAFISKLPVLLTYLQLVILAISIFISMLLFFDFL